MASLTAHRGRRRWRGGSGEETRWRGRGLEGGDVGEEGAGRRRGGGGAGLTIRVGASARVLTLLHVPHDERGARTDGIDPPRAPCSTNLPNHNYCCEIPVTSSKLAKEAFLNGCGVFQLRGLEGARNLHKLNERTFLCHIE